MPPGPILEIDLASGEPANRQIISQLRHHLVSGALAPGAALPSVRRLAADLGVHHNTVAEAYRALAQEGWLELAQGKAVRVARRDAGPALPRRERDEIAGSYEKRLRYLASEMRGQGLSATAVARLFRALAEEVG